MKFWQKLRLGLRRRKPGRSHQAAEMQWEVESLEVRQMLTAGIPEAISVGRFLSDYSTAHLQNNTLTIDYTVFNQQSESVDGVLLTTTLADGITIENSSVAYDRSGNRLSWNLGSLDAFAQQTVRLTVSLANPLVPQIDLGSQAFGTIGAFQVSDEADSLRLRSDNFDTTFLLATEDANSLDPFIRAKAAELNQDADAIFAFVRDEIAVETYLGSLRGSRGTLWSEAGNALDRSSLLIALMRASGVPTRYAQGELSTADAQVLIASMFDEAYQSIGLLPPGTELSDPVHDAGLIAEAQSHTWVQFDEGAGWVDADPSFETATTGNAYATTIDTFSEIDDQLRHHVTIRVDRELAIPAAALLTGESPLSRDNILTETFSTAELVGRTLTFGNLVSSHGLGALISAVTHTYTPYLQLGDLGSDPNGDFVILGENYQELITNFPLGTQLLTGLFLEIEVESPEQPLEILERTLYDRIGIDIRTHGSSVPLNVAPEDFTIPSLSNLDLTTIHVTSSLLTEAPVQQSRFQLELIERARQQLVAELPSDPLTADDALLHRIAALFTNSLIVNQRAIASSYSLLSDETLRELTEVMQTRAYHAQPRVTLISNRLGLPDENGDQELIYNIDLQRHTLRALPAPGQAADADRAFHIAHGIAETVLEAQVAANLTQAGVDSVQNTAQVFAAAAQQGIELVALVPDNISVLDTLQISGDAKVRIATAVNAGLMVVVPRHSVLINGKATVAWLETDPLTGETIGMLEDGTHGASSAEQAASLRQSFLLVESTSYSRGYLVGFSVGFLSEVASYFTLIQKAMDGAIDPWQEAQGIIDNLRNTVLIELGKVLARAFSPFGLGLLDGYQRATSAIDKIFGLAQRLDPPVPNGILLDPIAELDRTPHRTNSVQSVSANMPAGTITGDVTLKHIHLSGDMTISSGMTEFRALATRQLSMASARVFDADGNEVGSGTVSLFDDASTTATTAQGVFVSDTHGTGRLDFYADADDELSASATWASYTSELRGTLSLRVLSSALQLNDVTLSPGAYTIETDEATIAGRGTTNALTFVDTATILLEGTVILGATPDALAIAGVPTTLDNGLMAADFNGTLTIHAQTDHERVEIDGMALKLLQFVGPTSFTLNQNTTLVVPLGLETNQSGDFDVSIEAPRGWHVGISEAGEIAIRTPAGLQSGEHTVIVTARSTSDPSLVAAQVLSVEVESTAPDMDFDFDRNPEFFVPVAGTQVPTAYQANIRNLGPTADSFELSFSNIPAGFEIQSTSSTINIPAGETASIGVYLVPTTGIPAAGTHLPFQVTARSTSDNSISETLVYDFVVPEIRGLLLRAAPTGISSTPGVGKQVIVTAQAVGNVPSNVAFEIDLSAGLTATELADITLSPDESVDISLLLTPSAEVPLNTILSASILADFGGGQAITFNIPVHVVAPGVLAIADAQIAAHSLRYPELGNRLSDLSIALTSLVQAPDDQRYLTQALANLESIQSLSSGDELLREVFSDLGPSTEALAIATTPNDVLQAIDLLGQHLTDVASHLRDLSAHNARLFVTPTSQTLQPSVPRNFGVLVQNIGTETTTYQLNVNGLPTSLLATFDSNSLTLEPGEIGNVTLTVTPQTTQQLLPVDFTITATVDNISSSLTRTVHAALRLRREYVSVARLELSETFVEAGDSVEVSAALLNAANTVRDVLVRYDVLNKDGVVIETSNDIELTLSLSTSLETVLLESLDTTGLSDGQYEIRVHVTEADGVPISGAERSVYLLVGSPLTATLDISPNSTAPGTTTVSHSLILESPLNLGEPMAVVAQISADEMNNDVFGDPIVNGDRLYVLGQTGLHVIDISSAANPSVVNNLSTPFPQMYGVIAGDRLVTIDPGAASSIAIFANGVVNTYDLGGTFGNGDSPGRIATAFPNYQFLAALEVVGNYAFGSTLLLRQDLVANDIFSQSGTVLAFDINNNNVTLVDSLLDEKGSMARGILFESGGNFTMFGMAVPDATTLYVGSTTAEGMDAASGVGRMLVVDISDPTQLNDAAHQTILSSLEIPGTGQVREIAIDGDIAVVLASEGAWLDPFIVQEDIGPTGNIVLATLDISDARHPVLLHTQTLNRAARGSGPKLVELGNHRFAFASLGALDDAPQLIVIDATDPFNLVVEHQLEVPSPISGLTSDGNFLYATSDDGLTIYQLASVASVAATASVLIPVGTGITVDANSFSQTPTNILHGTDVDTYQWAFDFTEQSSTAAVTWNSTVANLAAGETRTVVLESKVEYSLAGTQASLDLGDERIYAEQILTMAPAEQTVAPGATTTFAVTVKNPTDASVTYDLAVAGIDSTWVVIPQSVDVAPHAEAVFEIAVAADIFAQPQAIDFVVSASSGGIVGDVQGKLTIVGQPALPETQPDARGIVASLLPGPTHVGQGASVLRTVRLTNVGSVPERIALSLDLPQDWSAQLPDFVDLLPGTNQYQDVAIVITPPSGAISDAYELTFQATSSVTDNVVASATIHVEVASRGVDVKITPMSGSDDAAYQVTVTNTGLSEDSFAVELAGPSALVTQTNLGTVTLGAGQSQSFSVEVAEIDFAFPGVLEIVATATAIDDLGIAGSDRALVSTSTTNGLSANFTVPVAAVDETGNVSLQLIVENRGNVEDRYEAIIVGADGLLIAEFISPQGESPSSVPLIILPGFASASLAVHTTLDVVEQGTLTVRIRSLIDPNRVTDASVTIVRQDVSTGEISGRVFVDRNGTGSLDRKETGLADVLVRLVTQDGETVAETLTDVDGFYSFTAPIGNYHVKIADVNFREEGSLEEMVSTTGGNTVAITLESDTTAEIHFGYQLPVSAGVRLADGTLYIVGTNQSDLVRVIGCRDQLKVITRFGRNRRQVAKYSKSDVQLLDIMVLESNDRVFLNGRLNVPSIIDGGDGNDLIVGGRGDDCIFGGNGNDRLLGRDGNDWIEGEAGNDRIIGAMGTDLLAGGLGNDIVHGGRDRDIVIGGLGADILIGGHEDDVLIGDETTWGMTDRFAVRDRWVQPQTYDDRVGLLAPYLTTSLITDNATDQLRGARPGRDLTVIRP